jgi:hypothetical protein
MINITRSKGDKKVMVNGIYGTKYTVFKVYEPTTLMGHHSAITHIDNEGWYGDIASRRLPAYLESLSAYSEERRKAVNSWREAQYMEAKELIFEMFPELNEVENKYINFWYGSIEVSDPEFHKNMEGIKV